jgi:hypothetical protein
MKIKIGEYKVDNMTRPVWAVSTGIDGYVEVFFTLPHLPEKMLETRTNTLPFYGRHVHNRWTSYYRFRSHIAMSDLQQFLNTLSPYGFTITKDFNYIFTAFLGEIL